ncbi:DUF2244 domain-containing protein [Fulvimarina sp. 2208YS6-2-32]|uniref:DUF2244 domain-containing protein n=1 Tax=Fulvimarina uroteuthidis TaxID=3098149 RepID=A0ABU5I6I3_9HYPH|nr:DUF2244 domain-containing protein [Fulvimarina sp. 2208YS6-2-32]MDY8111001.1 DUF2244 domain-containing protein [Fulvimarina sp. 2208YS6-2-32]
MDDNSPDAENRPFDADRPIFEALLTPYRSLGPRGFAVMMVLFGSVCFGAGLMFVAKGAWPVFGFLGLDVLILFVAFKLSYKAGKASEEVSVSRTDVSIRKISPEGRVREAHYPPAWTRFRIKRMDEVGIMKMDVASQGRSTEIGAFLNLDDRETFAKAFNEALGEAKRG